MKSKIILGLCVASAVISLTNMNVRAQESNVKSVLMQNAGAGTIVQSIKSDEEYVEAAKTGEGIWWGYTNLGIANVEKNLNIRKESSETASLVGKLPKDAACEILSIEGEWAHITSGEVEGYASVTYLFTGMDAIKMGRNLIKNTATVTCDSLKVRETPDTSAEVITQVPKGEKLDVVEEMGEWVKVALDDQEVYVSAQYVTVEEKLQTAVTMTELLYGVGVSDVRVELCEYAKEFLGNPYVWGGTSLTKGADCSGFVLSVFANYGVTLPHSSRSQANSGTKISANEAQPGDLFFYGNGSSINHVAIYIGGGQVIHASSPSTGIKISSAYYRTPVKVVKILVD